MTDKQRILILCTGNSARSQMAEGWLRAAAGERYAVHSAGSQPSGQVHPAAVEVMAEIGVDLSAHRSKNMREFIEQPFDVVLTVCDNAAEACPVFPGKARRVHHAFDDPAHAPAGQQLAVFRRVRDEIIEWCAAYFEVEPIHIRNARPTDLDAILALLTETHLPQAGLAEHIANALVAEWRGEIVGSIALEIYGQFALLRSAAVSPNFQKHGLGTRLTRAVLHIARQRQIEAVYLLTETAEHYFPKFGFVPISRGEVAAEVQQSEEFRGACPDSARALALSLSAIPSHHHPAFR